MPDITKAIWLTDSFREDPDTCERPVALGFSPEERTWAKEERTPEELVEIALGVDGLELLMLTALSNNDVGFKWRIVPTRVGVKDGEYFVHMRLDEEQTVDFLLEDERQINGQEALKHPDRLKGALTRTDGRKGTIAFLSYDEDIYQAENALLCDLYEEFFRQADVKTVKGLAKVLNKGWKLHLDRKGR